MQTLLRNKPSLYLFSFALLVIAYFGIGCYLISGNSITTDETAHLGAAYNYSKHKPLNPEHPVLLKVLNSFLFQTVFDGFESQRKFQYFIGDELLVQSGFDPDMLLASSRYVYLIFSSFFLFWFWFYCFRKGWLDRDFTIIACLILVFSPSFYSHANLITFDVPASLLSCMAVMTFALLIFRHAELSRQSFIIHHGIALTVVFAAVNTKYSTLVLGAVVLFSLVVTLCFSFKGKGMVRVIDVIAVYAVAGLAMLAGIWLLYTYAFGLEHSFIYGGDGMRSGKWAKDNIVQPFIYYAEGIDRTLSRTGDHQAAFVDGRFRWQWTFSKYSNFLFLYKENTFLIFAGIFTLLTGLVLTIMHVGKDFNGSLKLFVGRIKPYIPIILCVVIFPFLYYLLSSGSRLLIGYRHVYPILVFVYILLSFMICFLWKKGRFMKYIITFLMIGYVVEGVRGMSYNLSYTNLLWKKERWKLVSDSSYYWGQDIGRAYSFAYESGLLNEQNQHGWWPVVWGNLTPSAHMFFITGSRDYWGLNLNKNDYSITQNALRDTNFSYLIIDSFGMQTLYGSYSQNSIAADNFDFLMELKPVFTYNDTVWVFSLSSDSEKSSE